MKKTKDNNINQNSKSKPSRIVSKILIVGGGVSGIQSALDLANSGFKVYLLDKTPSIGGTMAQLDKTFPTNDCSMCILSPKLVEAGRHPNIDLVTYSEVLGFSGAQGDFKVKIKKKARSVDISKCTGCGTCLENCLVRYEAQFPDYYKEIKLDENTLKLVNEILNKHKDEEGSLLPILQDINEKYSYLPEDVLKYVSKKLNITLNNIYQLATFYTSLTLKPRGRYTIKVCLGTACYVKGASRILDEFERKLNIKSGETTDDKLFTLERVNCLGACAIGPTIMVNDVFYGGLNLKKVDELITELEKKNDASN